MFIVTAVLVSQAAVHRGFGPRGTAARLSSRRPQVAHVHEVEELCEAKVSRSCSWSFMDAECHPRHACRPTACGIVMCACKPLSVHALPPWQVLQLNFSSALDADAVHKAFKERARVLAPDRNAACLHRASREYIAARRARDTLLLLTDLKENPSSTPTLPPFAVTTKPLSHRWRASPSKQRNRGLGSKLTLLVAIKIALYRMFRDYKAKLTHTWWSRTRQIVRKTMQFGRRVVSSVLKVFRANASSFLALFLLSITAVPLALV